MTYNKLAGLDQFTGSEQWFRHPLNRTILFTEGAKYVADQAGAYWLLDEIALAQLSVPSLRAAPFQAWKLNVKDSRATLSCDDGNGIQLYAKEISFTDFPECGVTLWFADNVILLPGEY